MSIAHGGNVWRGGAPEDFLDFSASLNPDGAPEWVRAALDEGLRRVRYYPQADSRAARAGLAAHLGLPEACVLPTNGGMEAAALASRTPFPAVAPQAARLLGRPVIAQPAFQEHARLYGGGEDVRWDDLQRADIHPGDVVWLCNPNNPTGKARAREDMLRLLARAERAGARLVVDEAFIDYCPERSVRDRVTACEGLIVLGSLTKVLAIPGARLGFVAAHPSVIALIENGLTPWRLNCLAEAVAAALPGHEGDFARIRERNAQRRAILAYALRRMGANVWPSEANFLLCDFGRDMRPAVEALRQRNILVRPCGDFYGLNDGFVRLAVRTEDENARLIDALEALL